jgi:transaldolase
MRRGYMQIFIDSADIEQIKKWNDYGVIDGVTTNPSIMLKDRVYDVTRGAMSIAFLVNPRPVSVEVTTNNIEDMVNQARTMSSWAPNIIIKIPVINEYGEPTLGVINQLEENGIRVNATAALSMGQIMLAAKAGASYVSIFAGRVADEGGDAPLLIRQAIDWVTNWHYKARIIVGSIRAVMDIQQAAIAGAHVITVPPQFLAKMMDHKYTRETVRQFVDDAVKALEKMEVARPA